MKRDIARDTLWILTNFVAVSNFYWALLIFKVVTQLR